MPTVTMHAWHLAILTALVAALAAAAVWSHRQAKSWAARSASMAKLADAATTAAEWHRQNYKVTRSQLDRVAALVDDMVPHLPTSGAGPKLRRRARDLGHIPDT